MSGDEILLMVEGELKQGTKLEPMDQGIGSEDTICRKRFSTRLCVGRLCARPMTAVGTDRGLQIGKVTKEGPDKAMDRLVALFYNVQISS